MRNRNWLAIVTIAMIFGLDVRGGTDESGDDSRRVSVALILDHREYDPKNSSQSVLKCVVRNETLEPIVVPVGYDGTRVSLHSGQLTLQRVRPFSTKAVPKDKIEELVKRVEVDPGREKLVFELPLDNILLKAEKSREEWRWRWGRRPEPPLSPVHRWRKPGFMDRAVFHVNVEVAGTSLKSGTVTLKVTADDPEK